MSNVEFKAGDLVYFPAYNSSIHTLFAGDCNRYPVEIAEVNNFTKDGMLVKDHEHPSIFHATEENCELLSKLYGVKFEKPKKVLKGSDLTRKLLAEGKWVLCRLSDVSDEVASRRGHLVIIKNIDIQSGNFKSQGSDWLYAVPYFVIDPTD